MPGGFQLGFDNSAVLDYGTVIASSLGTLLTAAGSANAKGSYAQLVAATTYDLDGFYIWLKDANTNNVSYLVDIAIGGAGSEQILVANMVYNTVTGANSGGYGLWVPMYIPAGSRVAGRCQCTTASATLTASIAGSEGGMTSDAMLGGSDTYGVNTGTSIGTIIDPGAAANTKGSWAQISASITYAIGALQIVFDNQKPSGQTGSGTNLVDIGVGAGGSEVVIASNIPFIMGAGSLNSTGGNPANCYPPLIRQRIPSGTRLAVRTQSSNSGSGSRKLGASIIGYRL